MSKRNKPIKRGPGRPRIDPTGCQRPISVRLTPSQIRHLAKTYGGIGPGLRKLVDDDAEKTNSGK